MREQIIDAIFARMRTDSDLFFLNADMGINLVERFSEAFPDRYANVGIAEQNMISISAGLANLGYRPIAYTISNFLIHRCLEQLRNDVALHSYPIILIGTSTGFDNAPLGPTHHIVDDWGVLKAIPGIDIYCPSSVTFASNMIDGILSNGRPAYIRVPKGMHKEPASIEPMFKFHGSVPDVLLVSYGNPAQSCIELHRRNSEISVLVLNQLKPLNEEKLIEYLISHKRIVIVEDHFPIAGLYGSLCEIAARHSLKNKIESIAPNDYVFEVGRTSEYFMKRFYMDTESLLSITRTSRRGNSQP